MIDEYLGDSLFLGQMVPIFLLKYFYLQYLLFLFDQVCGMF